MAELSSIDIPTLKEYFPYEGEDLRMVLELAQDFIMDTDERIRQLQNSIEQNDAAAADKNAHAIKGASLTFGAKILSTICKEIELIGKSGNLAGAAEKFAEAQSEYARVRTELPATLKGMLP
jgi:HPt (histidine-containing phosphotransfer) domain-containing protein